MAGFLNEGLPALATFTGSEEYNVDTQLASGSNPASGKIALYKQALYNTTIMNTLNKTMVIGTIYFTQINIGISYTPTPRGASQSDNSFVLTGLNIPVGATGAVDVWKAYLYNSAGVIVAQSHVTKLIASVGASGTIQQIAFAGSDGLQTGNARLVTVPSGTYYMGVQSNGTTAQFKAINSPIWPLLTGLNIGSFGSPYTSGTTSGSLSFGAAYMPNTGPMASLY